MKVEELAVHIRKLATVDESEAPVISCYLDNPSGSPEIRNISSERLDALMRSISGPTLAPLQQAIGEIERYLRIGLPSRTRGFAAFARGGASPFFLPLQFEIPLPNRIAMGPTPNVYPLIEIRDNYDRYAILFVTDASSTIIGVQLGSIAEHIHSARPEVHRRTVNECTKDDYREYCRERTSQFLHTQMRSLERVMFAGRYRHMILAGSPRATSVVRKTLPKSLAATLLDVVAASASDRISDVVNRTIPIFIEREEMESEAVAERLSTRMRQQGMAVAGPRDSMRALKAREADMLVMMQGFECGCGWQCRVCGSFDTEPPAPITCPECGSSDLRQFEIASELVRLAAQLGCSVEVVQHSDALTRLGGVGCLLRFRRPETYACQAA